MDVPTGLDAGLTPDTGVAIDAPRIDVVTDTGTTCGSPGQRCCDLRTCVTGAECSLLTITCQACGGAGQPCCGGTTCGTDLVCRSGACQISLCGNDGQACCGGSTCNTAALACNGGTCAPCGTSGQRCCGGSTCNTGLACASGSCAACGGTAQPWLQRRELQRRQPLRAAHQPLRPVRRLGPGVLRGQRLQRRPALRPQPLPLTLSAPFTTAACAAPPARAARCGRCPSSAPRRRPVARRCETTPR
jgi:hypothetical protein